MLLYSLRRKLNPWAYAYTTSGAKAVAPAMEEQAADRDNDETIAHVAFLVGAYKPQAWWTEVFVAAFKVVITGVVVFFAPGTATQIVAALMVSLVAIAVQAETHPYLLSADNRLATLSGWAVSLALMGALFSFVDASGGGEAERVGFDAALVVCTVGVVAVGVYMAVEEAIAARWREISDNHASAPVVERLAWFFGFKHDDDNGGGAGDDGDADDGVGKGGGGRGGGGSDDEEEAGAGAARRARPAAANSGARGPRHRSGPRPARQGRGAKASSPTRRGQRRQGQAQGRPQRPRPPRDDASSPPAASESAAHVGSPLAGEGLPTSPEGRPHEQRRSTGTMPGGSHGGASGSRAAPTQEPRVAPRRQADTRAPTPAAELADGAAAGASPLGPSQSAPTNASAPPLPHLEVGHAGERLAKLVAMSSSGRLLVARRDAPSTPTAADASDAGAGARTEAAAETGQAASPGSAVSRVDDGRWF